jgi:hypothetical protein
VRRTFGLPKVALIIRFDSAATHITIDVSNVTTPIEGTLAAEGGVGHHFVGYMQLVSVLESVLEDARQKAAVDAPRPNPGAAGSTARDQSTC